MKSTTSPYVTYQFEEEFNIVKARYAKNLSVDIEAARSIVESRLKLTNGKKHYFFVDISNIREVTPEAKKFMQDKNYGLKNILAAAFTANNPVGRLTAQIYVKTEKDFETRFFDHEQEALSWLKSLFIKSS